ncbi:MAG: PHP domain-containing protein [Acidimicrobiia bacterium]
MSVDLHTHSNVSDGVETPAALMDLAADAGVDIVALTDHDTLDGIAEARTTAERHGMRFIPGVELSVDHTGLKMHMLVYFTEPGEGQLAETLRDLRTGRDERNVEIVAKLNSLGYEIALEDVIVHAAGPSVGRPHIADALIEKGYFDKRDDVFEHLLHDGGPAYLPRTRLTAVEAIRMAREIDAVPVIAHPMTIPTTRDGYDELFEELASEGLGGIEAHHSMHSVELRHHLTDVAARLNLAATGGSDYHGATKRTYRIGVGNGDLRVPYEAVEQLDAQRGR